MSKWVIWNPSHTRVNEHGVISCNIHWFQSLSVFCVSESAQCFHVQKRIWPVWKYGVHIPSHGSKCENSPIETAIDSGKSTHYLSHTSHEKSPIKSYYLHKHTLVIHIYIHNIHIHVTPHIPLCTESFYPHLRFIHDPRRWRCWPIAHWRASSWRRDRLSESPGDWFWREFLDFHGTN